MGENLNSRCQIAIPSSHTGLPQWYTGFCRDFGACDNTMQPAILTAVQIGFAFRRKSFPAERICCDNHPPLPPTLFPKTHQLTRQYSSAMLHFARTIATNKNRETVVLCQRLIWEGRMGIPAIETQSDKNIQPTFKR